MGWQKIGLVNSTHRPRRRGSVRRTSGSSRPGPDRGAALDSRGTAKGARTDLNVDHDLDDEFGDDLDVASAGARAELAAATRKAILDRSNRTIVPIRKTFVQTPRGLVVDAKHLAGPLAWFVTTRNARALKAYLMILAATSSGSGADGWSTTHPIRVWARAFGMTETAEESSATNAVSKALTKLEARQLITRHRRGLQRHIQVGLLREDATGDAYTRPDGKTLLDRFLRLDHAFWLEGWSEKLSLPAVAMLLVALSEKPGFSLPAERVPQWYGWSADTTERGLAELYAANLLHKVPRRRLEPLSPSGYGIRNHYYLLPPFGTFTSTTGDSETDGGTEDSGTTKNRRADNQLVTPAKPKDDQ